MRTSVAVLMSVVGLAAGAPAFASTEGVLRLQCSWRSSTDLQNLHVEKLTGSFTLVYDPMSDISGTITKEGLNETFVSGIRDRFIAGSAYYKEGGLPVEQHIEINRNTGAIKNVIKKGGSDTLLEGRCTRVSGPSFGDSSTAE